MGNAHDVARQVHAGHRVKRARGKRILRGLAVVGGSVAAGWIGLSIANTSTASALPQIGAGNAPGHVVAEQTLPQSHATTRQGGIPLLGKGIGNLIGSILPTQAEAKPAPEAIPQSSAAQAIEHNQSVNSPAAQADQTPAASLSESEKASHTQAVDAAPAAKTPDVQAKSGTQDNDPDADIAAPVTVLDALTKPIVDVLSSTDSPVSQGNPTALGATHASTQVDVQAPEADAETPDVPTHSAQSTPDQTANTATSTAAASQATSNEVTQSSGTTGQVTEPAQRPGAVAGLGSAGASLEDVPVVGWLTDQNDPVGQLTAPLLKPVTDAAAPVTAPVVNAAASLVKPVDDVTDELTAPVRESLRPVTDAVEPVTTTVAKTVEPVTTVVAKTVVEPVAKVAAPVVTTVADVAVKPVADVAAPVVSTVTESVVKPVSNIATPVVSQLTQTVVEPVTTTVKPVVETVTKPVNATVAPLTATVSGAVLRPVADTVKPVTSTVTEPVGGTLAPMTSQISTTLGGAAPTIGTAPEPEQGSPTTATISTSTTYRPNATFTLGLPEPVYAPTTTALIEPTTPTAGTLGQSQLPVSAGFFVGTAGNGVIGSMAPGATTVAPVDLGSYAHPGSLLGAVDSSGGQADGAENTHPASSATPERGPNPHTPQTPVPAPAAPSGPGGPGGAAGGSTSMSGGASSGAGAPAACLADRWNVGLASLGVLERDGERSLKCDATEPPTSPA